MSPFTAKELTPHAITVNAYAPGIIRTDLSKYSVTSILSLKLILFY